MRLAPVLALLLCWALFVRPARAALARLEDYERVELRVSETRPAGVVRVDRGSADGLAEGDLVLFHPRTGRTEAGNVLSVEPRSALVQLHDRELALALGTRGEVMVPSSRLQPEPGDEPVTPQPDAGSGAPAPGEREGVTWSEPQQDYPADAPLLARMRPVRPEERAPALTGLFYASGNGTYTTQDERSDAFLRAGTDARVENPFGHGGTLHLDVETNFRTTNVPDQVVETFSKLRIDRASYTNGGTRWDTSRWELGRFLQTGLVELGVLDGVEWGWRRKNGDGYGFSAGYMPEPDADFSTGRDFQVAGFYHWALDQENHLTLDAGYQKSWHDGDADRDLLVAKLGYRPADAWNVYATTWIDYYGSSDRVKGQSVELTQALLLASRSFADGSALNVSFTHQSIPEIERDEFQVLDDDELEDNRDDRLALYGWWMAGADRWHGELGGWSDEEEEGADLTLGIDFADLIGERSHLDLTGFGSLGEFSRSVGGQLTFGQFVDEGHWDVFYELSHHNVEEFANDADDILQHRLRAGRDFYDMASWSVSVYLQALVFDDEASASLGFYLQRSY